MTEKELLYMEDATSHVTNLAKIANLTIEALEGKDLKTFMKGEQKKFEALKQKLMHTLEEIENE